MADSSISADATSMVTCAAVSGTGTPNTDADIRCDTHTHTRMLTRAL